MSTPESEYSYVLPSIFVDSHQEPTDLSIMGAAAAYRRAHPDGPMVDSKQSEALKDGSILLRDILGAGLALVTADSRVRLVEDDGSDAPAAQGYEVQETPAPVKVIVELRVVTETRWTCPHCLSRWRKKGSHAGMVKKCRNPACGKEAHLHAPN